jgi:hypothetical protein
MNTSAVTRMSTFTLMIGAVICFFVGVAPAVVYADDDPILGKKERDGEHDSGDCLHQHLLDEAGSRLDANKCAPPRPGPTGPAPAPCKITVGEKKLKGECSTKSDRTPTPSCVCDTTKNQAQRAGISTMKNTVATILQSTEVGTVGCSQLPTLISVLVSTQGGVLALGPVNIADVRLLGHVDYIFAAIPLIAEFASTCGATFPSEFQTKMLLIKAAMIEALNPSSTFLLE